jgi:hypothetical protein
MLATLAMAALAAYLLMIEPLLGRRAVMTRVGTSHDSACPVYRNKGRCKSCLVVRPW